MVRYSIGVITHLPKLVNWHVTIVVISNQGISMAKKKSKKKHKKSNQKPVTQSTPKNSGKNVSKNIKAKPIIKTKKTPAQPSGSVESAKRQGLSKQSDSRRYLIFILLTIAAALLIVVMVLANQTNMARNDATNTGQDDLLKVQPGNPESLQPTGSNATNPQQPSSSSQNSAGSANDIQPQSPITPEQQGQIQQ